MSRTSSDALLAELVGEWDRLSEGTKQHVVAVVRSLAGDFTGTIRLECNQGGVGEHYQQSRITTESLKAERAG